MRYFFMNFDDEKDLQQILFLAARILERRHNQTDGSAPALIASPTNPDNPPQLSDDGKTIFFPALRDVREVTGSPAAEVNSQKEVFFGGNFQNATLFQKTFSHSTQDRTRQIER